MIKLSICNTLKYVKHNKIRLKEDSQEKTTEIFREFLNDIRGTADGLKGHAILENVENKRETIVLTFWDKKEDMENYYTKDNNLLQELVEKVKPMFEQLPERTSYKISSLEMY